MAVGPMIGIQITKPHIFEYKSDPDGIRKRPRVRPHYDPGLDLEELEEVTKINGALRYAGKTRQYAFEEGSQLSEGTRQETKIADGQAAVDRSDDDDYIGRIIARAAQHGEHRAPGRPADRQPPVVEVELIRQFAETIHQKCGQIE